MKLKGSAGARGVAEGAGSSAMGNASGRRAGGEPPAGQAGRGQLALSACTVQAHLSEMPAKLGAPRAQLARRLGPAR